MLIWLIVGFIIGLFTRPAPPPPPPPPPPRTPPQLGGFDAHPRNVCPEDTITVSWSGLRGDNARWIAEPGTGPLGTSEGILPVPLVDHGTDTFRAGGRNFQVTLFVFGSSIISSTPVHITVRGPNVPINLTYQTGRTFYRDTGGGGTEDAGWIVQRIFSDNPYLNPDDWSPNVRVASVEYLEADGQPITVTRDGRRLLTVSERGVQQPIPGGPVPVVGSWSLQIPRRPADPTPAPPPIVVNLWLQCG